MRVQIWLCALYHTRMVSHQAVFTHVSHVFITKMTTILYKFPYRRLRLCLGTIGEKHPDSMKDAIEDRGQDREKQFQFYSNKFL